MNGRSQRDDGHNRAAEVSVLIAAEIIVALVVWLLTRSTVGVVIAVVVVLALYLVLMLFPEARRALGRTLGRIGDWAKMHPIPVALLAFALVAGVVVPLTPQPCGPPLASPLTEAESGEGQDCVGVTDGDDGAGVFGDRLAPVMRAIKQQNDRVEETGGYVTIAFMAELAEGSPTAARAANELKGAFAAQVRANRGGLIESLPPIRLVVANMGRDERRWSSVVRDLKAMTAAPDRLVAVTGLGVSVRETLMATRALSAAGIPMVGDVITADGFNATGKVDPLRRGPIPGLFRIPFEVGTQFAQIEKDLEADAVGAGATALLVEDEFNGDPHRADLYARSLGLAFREGGYAGWHKNGGGEVNTFGGRGSTEGSLDSQFNQIANNLCAEPKDLVFYAGRARYLPNFIENLYRRSCSDRRLPPLKVITGSDASNLAAQPGLAAKLAANRVTVLYVPLAHRRELAKTANFPDFLAAYRQWGSHGFSDKDLDDGWAIMGHDAFLTAARGARNAAVEENGQVKELPTPGSVKIAIGNLTAKGTNTVPGATGDFTIDRATGDRAGGAKPVVHRLGGS